MARILHTNLGLPVKLFGTSGVKLFKTDSNIRGRKGFPVSINARSFLFKFDLRGISKSEINSTNARSVEYPLCPFAAFTTFCLQFPTLKSFDSSNETPSKEVDKLVTFTVDSCFILDSFGVTEAPSELNN
nr:hypothetical protein Iba_chr07cCG8140 [Ipomoea batatas]